MKHDLGILFENRRPFENSRPKKYAAGKIIISEGDSVDKIYYLDSGFVKVYTYVGQGSQRVAYIYRQGEVFPLTTYLSSNNIARFYYECMTAVELCELNSRKFQKKVKDNIELGEKIVQYTRHFDQQFLNRVSDLVSDENDQSRMVKALLFLMERAGSGKEQVNINLPLTTKDLAGICGLTAHATSHQLAYLKSKEVITKSPKIVVNKNKLISLRQKT